MEKKKAVVFALFNNQTAHQKFLEKINSEENYELDSNENCFINEVRTCKQQKVDYFFWIAQVKKCACGKEHNNHPNESELHYLFNSKNEGVNSVKNYKILLRSNRNYKEAAIKNLKRMGGKIINNDIEIYNYPYIKKEYLKRNFLKVTLEEFEDFNNIATNVKERIEKKFAKAKPINTEEYNAIKQTIEKGDYHPDSIFARFKQMQDDIKNNPEKFEAERKQQEARERANFEKINKLTKGGKIFFKTVLAKNISLLYNYKLKKHRDYFLSKSLSFIFNGIKDLLVFEPIDILTDNLDGKESKVEYRCMVIRNEIADISRCAIGKGSATKVPKEVKEFALNFVKDHQDVPQIKNKSYSLDIAKTVGGDLVVVELNPMGASGIYDKNGFKKIIKLIKEKC